MKCKSENKQQQYPCIKLCINQCMASFGIKPNKQEDDHKDKNKEDSKKDKQKDDRNDDDQGEQKNRDKKNKNPKDSNPEPESNKKNNTVNLFAQNTLLINTQVHNLYTSGSLCQTDCVASCGEIVMQDGSNADQITQCFKS